MKKILVTGVNGFIGRNIVEYMAENYGKKYEIVPISREDADLLEQDQVSGLLRQGDIDVVIHAATQGTLGRGQEYERLLLRNNLKMFLNLARGRNMGNKGICPMWEKRNLAKRSLRMIMGCQSMSCQK